MALGNKDLVCNINEDISLSSSEDEIGFQYFYHDQIEKDFIEDSSEAEAKARKIWRNFDYSTKITYLKRTKEGINDVVKAQKRRKSKYSPPVTKKSKRESNENNVIVKNENENEQVFQMEIQRLVASPAQYSFQPVCCICEIYSESSILLQCTGICKRYYHVECMKNRKENQPTEKINFQCNDCLTQQYKCILCDITDDLQMLLSCENSDCGRLYHRVCLDMGRFKGMEIIDNRIRSCPAHYCITCVREDCSHSQNPCKKLIECLRCPLSFHGNDLCMAAGALELSLSHVICPRHFVPKLIRATTYKPFHPSWCFKCFKPGVKVLCLYCPTSFHLECVDNIDDVNKKDLKNYTCSSCRNYRQPRYGEITFVKVSQYRWWPCEIIHPRNAPMNILKLSRPDGTYPVLFLGSNEYQWVAKTRSIDYNTARLSSICKDSGGSNKMDREFTIGLKSAAKIHQVFVNILRIYVPLKSISAPSMSEEELFPFINVKEPQKTIKFKPIKTNILVPPATLPPKIPPSICDCTDSCQLLHCKNYLNKIECQSFYCPTKNQCQNQQFTNHVNKNLAIFKTTNRGFGFKTMVSINKNDFIIEYMGDMITRSESLVRIQNAKKCNIKDFYIVKLAQDLFIDAGPKGNLSRYINHSCDPNCYLQRWIVNGYPRLGVFALHDIDPDQELTFDYRISGFVLKEDIFCLCNSSKCTGFLGPIKSLPNSPVKMAMVSRHSSSIITPNISADLPTAAGVLIDDLSQTNEISDNVVADKLSLTITDKVSSIEEIEDNLSLRNTLELKTNEVQTVEPIATSDGSNEISTFTDITQIDQSEPEVSPQQQAFSDEDVKTIHENFCYRCFDGGQLVLCDKAGCPKTYHRGCLGLKTAPDGIWYCPWHFCDVCGVPSRRFCVQCPSSFCEAHIDQHSRAVPRLYKNNNESRLIICHRHSPTEQQPLQCRNDVVNGNRHSHHHRSKIHDNSIDQ